MYHKFKIQLLLVINFLNFGFAYNSQAAEAAVGTKELYASLVPNAESIATLKKIFPGQSFVGTLHMTIKGVKLAADDSRTTSILCQNLNLVKEGAVMKGVDYFGNTSGPHFAGVSLEFKDN